jgi:hypothetical protein
LIEIGDGLHRPIARQRLDPWFLSKDARPPQQRFTLSFETGKLSAECRFDVQHEVILDIIE